MLRFTIIICCVLVLLGVAAPPTLQPLPEISCAGFSAFEYASGLSAPDGLAISPIDGNLYVAEETAGRVTKIDANGNKSTVLDQLDHPEGITFDGNGTLYAVEDIDNGRVRAVAVDGTRTTWASDLAYPEGIVWSGGRLFVTESNIETLDLSNPITELAKLRSWIAEISAPNVIARTEYPYVSFSGITSGNGDTLYVANEIAGFSYNGLSDTRGVFRGARINQDVFAKGVSTPEGLRFSPNGFPLYVAEESLGRISEVIDLGKTSTVCSGFESIEDLVFDTQGRMFVSEDGRGRIVMLLPAGSPTPTPQPDRKFTWIPLARKATN